MSFSQLTTDLNIIQSLLDEPNDVGGLTAAQLKAKFDQAANSIKTYINSTLLTEMANTTDNSSGADNIGATNITDLDGSTVQALIESIRNKLKSVADGSSGADFVKATGILGLDGDTVQSLLESLKNYSDLNFETKSNITNNRKLDSNGNFTGSWYGITSPTYADPGIANVVADHTVQLANKVNQSDLDYANAYTVKVRSYLHKQMLGLSGIRAVTVVGDSITNGEGVTNEYQQFATMLKTAIYGMQNSNGAVYELISNFQYKKSSLDITYSGTYSFTENIPNGDADSITLQVGAAINFTRDINNIVLYFNRSASAGSVAIYQDGALKQTISLSGADAKHVMIASNDFRGGSHLYSIQCTGAPVTITGLGTFKNTSQTNLITFHRLGYSGKTLYEFQNTSAIDFVNKVGKYGSNPTIMIVELGTNDIFNSNCTPAQLQTRLQATAQGLVSAGNYVYLCVPYIPDPNTHPVNQGQNFQDFRKIYYTVAKAVGCGVIDLSIMDFVGSGWLSADGLHPNEAGHAAIAKAISDSLGIQQKGFMQLQKYTLNMTDISSSGANGSKFILLGNIPYDATNVNIMIRNKTNGIMVDYREVADYANGYGLTINKGLNAEPRWGLYKLVNGALRIQASNPISAYLSTTDSDNEVIISYLF